MQRGGRSGRRDERGGCLAGLRLSCIGNDTSRSIEITGHSYQRQGTLQEPPCRPSAASSKSLDFVSVGGRRGHEELKSAEGRPAITRHFATLEDPRVVGRCSYPLETLLVIALLAVICGAEGWMDLESFAESKASWLVTFLEMLLPGALVDGVAHRLADGHQRRGATTPVA